MNEDLSLTEGIELGRVQSSDTQDGIVTFLLLKKTSEIHIGMPVVFDSDEFKYFGIIIRIYQPQNIAAINISRRKDFDPDLGTRLTSNPNTTPFNIFVDVKCLKRWRIVEGKVQKQNFVSIPNLFTTARTATFEEIQQIYSNEKFKNYWFGALDSVVERDPVTGKYYGLPVDMVEMTSKPMGIFGATGFGKSVTMRNLCKAVIHDPDDILLTSMLIFDVQNEYSYKVQDSNERGLLAYPIIEDRILPFTLDEELWNASVRAEHTTTSGFAKRFRLFKRNIDVEDVIAVLAQSETFSDVMLYTMYRMSEEASRENVPLFDIIERFYDDVDGYGRELNENDSSRRALRRRLYPFVEGSLSQFIEDGTETEKDTYEYIKDYLDRRVTKQRPKSFILHFGRYGSKEYIYTFIATVLTRKLYDLYSGIENQEDVNDERPFYPLVIVLEESHKFIGKSGGIRVFSLIARETRKFGLALWYVDQMPSTINPEIIAQSAHRIIHKLNGGEDIAIALSGLNREEWAPIVNALDKGRCLVFGPMVDYIPTIIHSYYNPNDFYQECMDRKLPTHYTSKSSVTMSATAPAIATTKPPSTHTTTVTKSSPSKKSPTKPSSPSDAKKPSVKRHATLTKVVESSSREANKSLPERRKRSRAKFFEDLDVSGSWFEDDEDDFDDDDFDDEE